MRVTGYGNGGMGAARGVAGGGVMRSPGSQYRAWPSQHSNPYHNPETAHMSGAPPFAHVDGGGGGFGMRGPGAGTFNDGMGGRDARWGGGSGEYMNSGAAGGLQMHSEMSASQMVPHLQQQPGQENNYGQHQPLYTGQPPSSRVLQPYQHVEGEGWTGGRGGGMIAGADGAEENNLLGNTGEGSFVDNLDVLQPTIEYGGRLD